MKIKHLSLLLLVGLLASCGGNTTPTTSDTPSTNTPTSETTDNTPIDTSKLKIVSPTGAPAVAFYKHGNNKNYTTNAKPSNILSMLTAQSDKDVVVIDTVGGLRTIQKGAPYKIAATITFGNFFIASTGNDENDTMDKDDKIVLFGQEQTPDLLFHYLYGNEYDESIEYVASVQDAAKCLTSGKNLITKNAVDYVFIAQPVLHKILNNPKAPTFGKAKVYADVQELYKTKSGGAQLTQASVFVKNSTDTKVIDQFLFDLENDIDEAIKTPSVVSTEMVKLNSEEASNLFGIDGATAEAVLKNNNALGLGFVKARDNKKAIDTFANIFGLNETTEKIYY